MIIHGKAVARPLFDNIVFPVTRQLRDLFKNSVALIDIVDALERSRRAYLEPLVRIRLNDIIAALKRSRITFIYIIISVC